MYRNIITKELKTLAFDIIEDIVKTEVVGILAGNNNAIPSATLITIFRLSKNR